jgi:hypothetical protein
VLTYVPKKTHTHTHTHTHKANTNAKKIVTLKRQGMSWNWKRQPEKTLAQHTDMYRNADTTYFSTKFGLRYLQLESC